jgi:flagellar protein FlgJ
MLPTASVYTDLQGLSQLRADARQDAHAPQTLRKVATQFEALFLQNLLKSMRSAKLGEDMLGSNEQDHYWSLFDSQISLKLAEGRGVGIADLLVRQLSRGREAPAGSAGLPAPAAATGADDAGRTAIRFTKPLWPHAEAAGRALGVSPRAILAQAALETGWGRSVPRHADGRSSFNLFGIKAGSSWKGETVQVSTTEYVNGKPVTQVAEFRSYRSHAEAFADYVRFLKADPRYQHALAANADAQTYGQALQKAGYATDPAYGRKIGSVANGVPFQQAMLYLKITGSRPIA